MFAFDSKADSDLTLISLGSMSKVFFLLISLHRRFFFVIFFLCHAMNREHYFI